MKLKEISDSHRNDFSATYECEHCKYVTKKSYGYRDDNFFDKVIPGQLCPSCGLNRAGNKLETKGVSQFLKGT